MNLWLIFLTGLTTGGFTCAAMQGGILASLIANQKNREVKKGFGVDDWGPVVSFLTAKLLAHLVLGLLLGLLGSVVDLSLSARLFFQAFAALFMFSTAMNLLDIHPIFRYVCLTPPKFIYKFVRRDGVSSTLLAPGIFGLLTVFIPCGVTQAMAVLAINSGSWLQGGLIMGSFVLGTIPMFALIGISTARFSELWRRDFLVVAAIVLIFMSLQSINGIMTVLNSPYSLERFGPKIVKLLPPYNFSKPTIVTPDLVAGVQPVTITIDNDGYMPKSFAVKAGIPVSLKVSAGEVYTCAAAFTFRAFGINAYVKPNTDQIFTFTPDKKGLYTFSCSMGMYSGTMEVI